MDTEEAKGWINKHFGNSQGQLDARQELLRLIGNRLFVLLALSVLLVTLWIATVNLAFKGSHSALPAVFFTGVLGGVIGLQNRLMDLTDGDLLLLTKSLMYLLLAPLVGGFMAVLLYILFISGLVSGDLFPSFSADSQSDASQSTSAESGIGSIFQIHATSFAEYGKLIFWSFVAGFSERFVTRIISRFESSANPGDKPVD